MSPAGCIVLDVTNHPARRRVAEARCGKDGFLALRRLTIGFREEVLKARPIEASLDRQMFDREGP